MERTKCRICEAMVENVEEHVKIEHKSELEQVLLTKKNDDVSIWIRERTGDDIKETHGVEETSNSLMMNSTYDEDLPNEDVFSSVYQHTFANESNFETSDSFERSNSSPSMEIDETNSSTAVVSAIQSHERNFQESQSRPDKPYNPPKLELSGRGLVASSATTARRTFGSAAIDGDTDRVLTAEERAQLDAHMDGDVEYADDLRCDIDDPLMPNMGAYNAAQRIQRLIEMNTSEHHASAVKKVKCRVCGHYDPNKHKHVLRHLHIRDMFACSFCDMTHHWNRQVIIEHGKRKHCSSFALISQEGKYADEIAAMKIKCFSPDYERESPRSKAMIDAFLRDSTAKVGRNFSAQRISSIAGVSNSTDDQPGKKNPTLSPKCNVCGQATLKRLKHALRHLNQNDMFSCSHCPFSHPWNKQIVEQHLALRHDVQEELTSVLVTSRIPDFEVEIAVVHRMCFEINNTGTLMLPNNSSEESRRSYLAHYSNISASPANRNQGFAYGGAAVKNAQTPPPPIRLLTNGGRVRLRINGSGALGPVRGRTVLTTMKGGVSPVVAKSTADMSATDHEYIHYAPTIQGPMRVSRVLPRVMPPYHQQKNAFVTLNKF